MGFNVERNGVWQEAKQLTKQDIKSNQKVIPLGLSKRSINMYGLYLSI